MRPVFSVFTPTYNSVAYLHRVKESLVNQSRQDFEWIVVDDASKDGTLTLIKTWQATLQFPVVVVEKAENAGILDSYNRAVALARGEFFVPAGHDDTFAANTLDFVLKAWEGIPLGQRHRFYAITTQCLNESGQQLEELPNDQMDSSFLDMYFLHKCRQEQWSIFRTDVLRKFSFPPNRRQGEMVYAWFPMAEKLQSRFFNTALRTYYRDNPTGLSSHKNPKIDSDDMSEIFRLMFRYTTRYWRTNLFTGCMHLARFLRFSHHAGRPIAASIQRIPIGWRWLLTASVPITLVMLLNDYRRIKRIASASIK